ncbi:MAG: hypothetical protein JW991_03570 [Candidatus Pacebacteria bacterium]|nr:hypothetical protein [Candidatus Paceibacterota bacterium]
MKSGKPASTTPVKASTQSFLEIEDIKEGIVILKDGSCILIITTTAINFGLLSEKEQDAAIYAYGALLNSLTFSIQILIRSKRKDITAYLKLITEQEKRTVKKEFKTQIQKYHEFIQNTVQVNNVLEKSFYIIIPMSSLELGISQNLGSKLKKKRGLPFPKDYVLNKAKTNLFPKRDHLIRLLNRLGLRSRQLNNQELIKLFYEIYNPNSFGQILSTSADYETPLVKPAANFIQAPVVIPAETAAEPTEKSGQTPESPLPPAPPAPNPPSPPIPTPAPASSSAPNPPAIKPVSTKNSLPPQIETSSQDQTLPSRPVSAKTFPTTTLPRAEEAVNETGEESTQAEIDKLVKAVAPQEEKPPEITSPVP